MFNHIMVGASDIERSKTFYDAVLGTLGAGEALRNEAPTGHVRYFYRHDRQNSAQIDGRQSLYRPNFKIGREPNQRQARIDQVEARDGS